MEMISEILKTKKKQKQIKKEKKIGGEVCLQLLVSIYSMNQNFFSNPCPMLQRLDVKQQHIYRRRKNFPRSVFSPLVSAGQGDCVVSASEDGSVHFFQLTKQDRACINKLQVFNFFCQIQLRVMVILLGASEITAILYCICIYLYL